MPSDKFPVMVNGTLAPKGPGIVTEFPPLSVTISPPVAGGLDTVSVPETE